MKHVFEVKVRAPGTTGRPWAFTLRCQEYRGYRPYGGAAVEEVTMRKNATYNGTMREARAKLKKMIGWALT